MACLLILGGLSVSGLVASEAAPLFVADPPWLEKGGLSAILASRELEDGTVLLSNLERSLLLDRDGAVVGGGPLVPQLSALQVRLLAIDPFGAVFVAGSGYGPFELYLMKYDGRSGRALWEGPRRLGEPHASYEPLALVVDAAGNPTLLSQAYREEAPMELVAFGFRGDTGEARWGPRHLASGSYQESPGLAIDGSGDVLVVFSESAGTATQKLAGATGQTVWGPVLDAASNPTGYLVPLDAAADPVNGDLVYLALGTGRKTYLFKRSGGTGALLWGHALVDGDGYGEIARVAVDADGDPLTFTTVTTIPSPGRGKVRRFAGATGSLRWGPLFTRGVPENWAFDGRGTVVMSLRDWGLECLGWNGSVLWERAEAPSGLYGLDTPLSTVLFTHGRLFHAWRASVAGYTMAFSYLDPSNGTPLSGPSSADDPVPGLVSSDLLLRLPGGPLAVTGTSNDPQALEFRTVVYAVDASAGAASWGPTWIPAIYPRWLGYRFLGWLSAGGLTLAGSRTYGMPSETQVTSLRVDGSVRWGPVSLTLALDELVPVAGLGNTQGDAFVLGASSGSAELYRLNGDTGATQYHVSFPLVQALALGMRPDGDLILLGRDPQGRLLVSRCAAATGLTTWATHLDVDPASGARALVDGNGHVIAVTSTALQGQQSVPVLYKLNGTTGALTWGPVRVADLYHSGSLPDTVALLDPNGDVLVGGNRVVAGTSAPRIGVVKLLGATGGRTWGPATLPEVPHGGHSLSRLATTTAGKVVVVFQTTSGGSPLSNTRLVCFDGGSGSQTSAPLVLPFSPRGFLVDGDRLFISAGGRVVGYRLDGLGISALSLPSGACGLPYSAHLDARNGDTPLSHEVVSGSLPPGLTLDPASGEIAGIPTATGAWPFRVSVRDAGAQEVSRSFDIEVVPSTDLVVPPPPALCPGESATLTAPSGFAQYRWLRDGETTPTLTVSPADATTYGFEATDGNGCAHQGAVRVEVVPDRRPPDVLAPDPVVLRQTGCSGGKPIATAATSSPLAAFLSGGAGFETCGPGVLRLPPQMSGADVTAATTFAAGVTTVVFRFADVEGNVGHASSAVTVQAYGDVDGNARLDVFDGVILASYLVGNVVPGSAPFSGPAFAADVNGDGTVDVFDLVTLVSYVVGNVPCLGGLDHVGGQTATGVQSNSSIMRER